ncbi:hypothetical protein E7V67_008660 [[Empedobacter] haloabium]|uniref:NERD domain-containing protein n=1 Tax=[Empedobacter] haloabium TaxID=592317 RepID=A0ABZ1UR16_9BURK
MQAKTATGRSQDSVTQAPERNGIDKGAEGERQLNDWFSRHLLPYVAICQAPGSFAPLFRGAVKRPDFLMLVEGVGLLAIDAKNKKCSHGFTLELETELKKAVAFERLFRLPLWYAFSDCDAGMDGWYWISALKAVEVGMTRTATDSKLAFLAIELKHFEHIRVPADLAKLYTHRAGGYERLRDLGG